MLGYLRLALAILVMLSHIDITIAGLNPGVMAVVIFYMLAGMVTTHLWENVIPQQKGKLFTFYRGRLKRILPLYMTTLVLTLLFISVTAYGQPEYTLGTLLNNIFIVPLNYYMYINSNILTSPSWCLIPPAWSLGAEIQAYLLMPFLLIHPRLCFIAFLSSISLYSAANYNLIPADDFGYRLIPGVLFIFIIGSYIKKAPQCTTARIILLISYLVLITEYLLLSRFSSTWPGFSQETRLGIIIGMPLLIAHGKINFKIPYNSIAGSISYGVFLMHFLVIWVLDRLNLLEKWTPMSISMLVIIVVLCSLIFVYLIENKLEKLILKMKRKKNR